MANASVHLLHQRPRRRGAFVVVPLLVVALIASACGGSDEPDVVASTSAIPTDVQDSCPVPAATFDSWFDGGEPSVDGAVNTADSVGFPTTNTVCDFYTWGAQMFLWLTSPEGDGLVLDGPSIFTVAPAVGGTRQLIANTDESLPLALRAEKTDDIGEIGQAGTGGVLMSQGESLVYYGVHVNDVYAYFLTGKKGGDFSNATTFPRNQSDLDEILNYVDTTFPDATIDNPDALTMELKTSWIDASTIPVEDRDQFVMVLAEVPDYTRNTDAKWTATGDTVEMTLALTGIHIVGTVQNHPEFIWITYEHKANAPFANYMYTDAAGDTVEQAFDSTGDYQFMAMNGTEAQSNGKCMTTSNNVIEAQTVAGKCDGTIEPSDTYSMFPWGSPSSDTSDGTTEAVIKNNTLLLSLNNSVMSQLGTGDVRQNYIQTGGIWTSAPGATSDAPIPGQPGYGPSDLRGSLKVFNTTMETYAQNSSCFSCHTGDSFESGKLSHIFAEIEPLELPG